MKLIDIIMKGQLVEDDSGSVLLPAKYDIANIHFWRVMCDMKWLDNSVS